MAVNQPPVPVVGASDGQWGQILDDAITALVAQISNIDNTADLNKPISTLVAAALATKAPVASPALTGLPTVPTATPGTSSTQVASTEFVTAALAASGQLTPLFPSAATFGSATKVPQITRDAFGRITGVTEVPISVAAGGGSVTGAGLTNPMTAAGDLIVGGASGSPLRLAAPSLASRRFLRALGTGTAPGTPTWDTLSVNDVLGLAAAIASVSRVNLVAAQAYTAVAADAGATIEMNSTLANAVTIPPNSSVPFPIGTFFYVRQVGVGVTNVVAGAGVTLRTPATNTLPGQWSTIRLEQRALNDWVFVNASLSATAGGGTAGTGTGSSDPGSASNLIADGSVQNASDPAKFSGSTAVVITADSSVSKSGGSSLKVQSTSTTNQPFYVSPLTPSQWAPVTPGATYTGFVSVRRSTTLAYPVDAYLVWYDSAGNQLGISNVGASTPTVQNSWVQVIVTGAAPANAKYAGVMLETLITAGTLASTDTFNVDEVGINAGANSTWTSTVGTVTPPSGAATATNTGFSYTGSWQAGVAGESYSGVSGDIATISFTVGTGGGTVSLLGIKDPSNGTASVKIDSGTSTTVSESGTHADRAVQWTSGTLVAGNHTLTVTVATPDFSIEGATLTNGAFIAPNSNVGSGAGGGTTSTSNPSGVAMPASNAFAGYTRVLAQDFTTDAAVGAFSTAYAGYNGYDGGTSGASGTVWSTATTCSVANGMLRMRQYRDSSGTYTPAITPVINGSAWNGLKYGKWMARFRADTPSQYWKTAWLLWPNTGNWSDGEIDYPEQEFDSKIRYNIHEVTGTPSNNVGADSTVTFGDGAWHTATITWDATGFTFEIDGVVIGTQTAAKYQPSVPMRWALQNEITTQPPVGAEASVYIDWIAVFSHN